MTAAACRPAAEKRCNVTKAKVPNSRSALSQTGCRLDGLVRMSEESQRRPACHPVVAPGGRLPPPHWVDASTGTWRVIQGVTPPPPA